MIDIGGVEYEREAWEKCLRWLRSKNGKPFWDKVRLEMEAAHAKAAPLIPARSKTLPDRPFEYFVAEALQHAAVERTLENMLNMTTFVAEVLGEDAQG